MRLVQKQVDLVLLLGVAAGGQAVVDRIAVIDGRLQVVKRQHRDKRQEQFLAVQAVLGGQACRHRRAHVMAISQLARAQASPARQQPAGGGHVFASRAIAPPRRFVDQRPHEHVALTRVAHHHRLGSRAQPIQKGVVHRRVRVDLRPRRTLLPLQPEGGAQHALHGHVQVRAGGDVGGILAAHLGDDGPRVAACRHRLQQLHAHVQAAGEGVAVDARVMRQQRARLGAAVHAVHAPRRHARRIAGAQQQRTCQRRAGRRLIDHGIARQQGGAHHVHRQGQGKIERRNHREHAIRAQHIVRAFVIEGARQRLPIAIAAFGLIAVVADQVHRFLGLAQRFQARLADLDNRRHGEVVLAFGQHHRQTPQHRDARRPALRGPRRLRMPGAGDGAVHGIGVRTRKAANQQPMVDRRIRRLQRFARHRLATEAMAMVVAQHARFEIGQPLVQQVVHR
ncbi:hypothetical protein D3C72_1110160 [compost metagenome]